ncbi:UTP20, snoRNA-binding protein and member of the SSU processome [Trichoderma guizhouense]|uniref:UTP20, snoRNA-binding protein and member of the SSU processome n=1 Tax=Trichoderma guizhouense TaxID=1491466 RepID=A0A1T3CLT5_9HYPO|nr:UTP20, snoRNA-binding protein and member of the SSU processome [Trichoderma guizhouense]
MPARSSGRIEKARKNKHSTPHQKNHRWESFSTKIAKFNSLQPLRKVRRHDLDSEDLSSTTSYLQNGLQKWSELNISQPFSSFKREVLPLCDSLPQILHFEERIMASFAKYISTQDKEGLEPLLDLLTAFAHDLGIRFEKYFSQSLDLILAIAGRSQPVEVIEWTFGALAFLFKYLSKLIVPDLRPTYAVMAPLLGKSKHPPFIARFGAEAMSFLVRKAAAPSLRETALVSFVDYVRDDICKLVDDRQFMLYKDGIMTMFAEAIKGTDRTVHSTGSAIFIELMNAIPKEECTLAEITTWTDLVCGVLTSVIHHTEVQTFREFEEAIFDSFDAKLKEAHGDDSQWWMVPYIRVLGVLAGVRKGGRITDWTRLVQQLTAFLSAATRPIDETVEQNELLWALVVVNVAITCHHAPMDSLIPHISRLLQSLTREPFMRLFIPFCSYFSGLDPRRFGSLFRSDFQKFIATHWSQGQNEDMLCVLLPQIIENRGFPSAGEKDCCKLPQAWQDQIVSKFENLEISPFPERGPYNKDPQVWRDRCLPKYATLLRILELTAVHPSTNARIAELLLRKLKLALRPSSTLASDEVNFIVSQGFHAYLGMSKTAGSTDPQLAPLLRAAVPRFARSVGFLRTYLAYEQTFPHGHEVDKHEASSGGDTSVSEDDPVIQSLVENLSSPSHDIRLASLELLNKMSNTPEQSHCVEIMLQIEQSPLNLEHTRSIAMYLRKLGQEYGSLTDTTWLKQGIPNFMFGMLTVNLSPVWEDSIEAMKQVAENKQGEDAISLTAFRWLDVSSPRWTPPQSETGSSRAFYSDFECTALNALQASGKSVQETSGDSKNVMLRTFDDSQRLVEPFSTNAKAQALKVFKALPSIAERRSRQLVPHLFAWAREEEDAHVEEDAQLQTVFWSLADRKGLVGVFAQFINPRVLFQHERVYDIMLQLLGNGDLDVQKLALKAILAWKQDGVKAYQENLEYLLDEARFKNEITVFLQGDSVIKSEHRTDLMPVLLHLLYGRAISRKGGVGGRHGQQTTRLAIIRNLSIEDLGGFLDIAVGKLKDVRVVGPAVNRKKLFDEEIISVRKQFGFLNMALSLISELGTNVSPYMETLVNTILYCLIFSCRRLGGVDTEVDPDAPEEEEKASTHSLLKSTRSTGIKCLIALFQNAQDFQWEPYQDIIIEELVAPRHENLPAETAQGVSGMLQLLSTWSNLPKAALFLAPHGNALPDGALPKIISCIAFEKSKESVKIYVLEMLRSLARLAMVPASESEFNEVIKAELLDPNSTAILDNITTVLRIGDISNALLETGIETILSLAPVFQTLENVQAVIRISSFLLQQPARRVNPKLKGRILLVIENFASLPDAAQDEALLQEVYKTVSSLFSYFKDRENRSSLCRVLLAISKQDAEIFNVANLCYELNLFKEGRIDEPDYDRRLAAFSSISSSHDEPWSPRQWLPVLHNLIFFIRMDEEFGVLSSNAADGIRRLVQEASDCQSQETKAVFDEYLKQILMPSIYGGAREESETVRREYLRVLGFILTTMPEWAPVADLGGLLNERQEDSTEPSFFFDILSPATAKQMDALRTLEAANASKEMGSQNLTQFFIPLLEHFIFGRADGGDDHGLGAQAASTISNLAMSLNWNHFRTTFHRYIGYIESRQEQQKHTIRLLGKFTDALLLSLPESPDAETMEVDQEESSSSAVRRLRLMAPKPAELATQIMDYFLPPLTKHLHQKDESEVSYRVPVGITIVKLLKLLPGPQMDQKLAGVLTDICHILRSKAWEAREMTRDTLVKIAVLLGPSFFGFILKELRGALTKGYQLHVLSYTVHSILVATVPHFAPGDLNPCLSSIVTVIMDDIFGVVGQEKDAEGYVSQMKEVKSSKSQDSMELIAKNASISRLIELVRPLQALLLQKVDLKIVRKIDALLARITAGLLQNPATESRDTLVFCYEVIQEVYNARNPEAEPKLDWKTRRYLVQRGAKKSDRGQTSKHTYKLTRFAFEMLRSILKKYDSIRIPENISGFIPIIGDAILEGEDEVKISAFRLLAVIVKVPFETADGANIYKIAVKEATRCISMSTSTTTDLAQAALKMLAVVLRDRRDIEVKDAAIDMLLGKLKDDFTEPLYRHITFNFLRSVLDRRIETATVYDTLDQVGTVMITNDDKDTRDLARGAFFQFIRDYPQMRSRWTKQLNFVVANLKYDREGGRISVMEVIHLLLMKSSSDFIQEIAATCFLPLFLVLANDDSEKCRLAAEALIKEIFRKADKERVISFLNLLRSWLGKDGNATVVKLAVQLFGYYFECHEDAVKNQTDFKLIFDKVMTILGSEDVRDLDGGLVGAAIGDVRIFVTSFPEKTLSANREELWAKLPHCLGHNETSVKLAAIQVISLYLADFAQRGAGTSAGEDVEGSHGLTLRTGNVEELVRLALKALNGTEVNEGLANELGQVLIFLGPRLPIGDSPDSSNAESEADELDAEDKEEPSAKPKDLQYLFWRLSHILRKEIRPNAVAIIPKVVAMEVLETICRRSALERLQPSLKTILTPLHNLTDPSIPAPFSMDEVFKTKHEGLKTRAQIMMDSLQKKFGTAEYSKQLMSIREEVKARRLQRSSKRKIEAVAQPEKYSKDKRKKFEKNRERKKTRSKEQKVMRQAYKTW